MTDTIAPPDGQLSFSGIPSAEFIEDVDSHMAAEESAESQLKVKIYSYIFNEAYQANWAPNIYPKCYPERLELLPSQH